MNKFYDVFKRTKGVVVGMCHLQALPGCPKNVLPLSKTTDIALKEAELYMNANVDAIMIENMHDVPYVRNNEIGPEIIAGMTTVATKLKQQFPQTPLGIQILTSANKEALAVAKCAGLDFIRCECFAFSHIGDEGWMDACAGSLLRYRRMINADHVLIFTDVKKKHSSHSVTSDVTIAETARACEFFLSDGIIVTGKETGAAADEGDVEVVRAAVDLPVLVGSGMDANNLDKFAGASAFIVGSYFKQDGSWKNSVDSARVEHFMRKINELR